MNRIRVAALGLAAALAVGSLAGCARPKDPGTFVIGFSASRTGANKVDGTSALEGTEYAVQAINAAGGWLGHRLVLDTVDDQSDATAAREAYTRFVTQDQADFLIGPYSPDLASAAGAVAARYHKVMLDPETALSIINGRGWAIQAEPGADKYLMGLAETARAAGDSSIAVLGINNAFGNQCAAAQRADARKHGLRVVYSTAYASDDDFSAISQAIKSSGAQVVDACSYFTDGVALIRALHKIDYRPKMTAETIAPSNAKFGSSLGDLAEGVVSTTSWSPSLPTAGNPEFVAGFTQRFGHPPDYHAANNYAALQALGAAVRATGSTDQQRIRDALYTQRYETVLGTFRLDRAGFVNGYLQYLNQIQHGTQKVIWPQNVAESPLRRTT